MLLSLISSLVVQESKSSYDSASQGMLVLLLFVVLFVVLDSIGVGSTSTGFVSVLLFSFWEVCCVIFCFCCL